MKKTLLTIFTTVFSVSIACCQGLSMDETKAYINGKFPEVFTVEIEKEREMSINFYKDGAVYRTDRIYLITLDAKKTSFSVEEDALIIRCKDEQPKEWRKFNDGCIERTFHQKGKIAMYARTNLKIGNDKKTIQGLTNAFNHLIMLAQEDSEYMGVDSFE